MTNAEAAAHFASLPPNDKAEVLLIEGDTGTAEVFEIDAPGTNLEEVEDEFLEPGSEKLPTIFRKW